jgi:hypothetical protein
MNVRSADADGDLSDLAYRRSVELLKRSYVPEGFVASAAQAHYAGIWARDALITSLGANLTGDEELVLASRRTLETLGRLQAPLGQIPNAYWPARSYWDWGEAGSLDATALFIIAAWEYVRSTSDDALLATLSSALEAAFTWLRYQDPANFGLVSSPPAADWMDSTLTRSGMVLYLNVLYYWASRAMASIRARLGTTVDDGSDDIRFKIDLLFWPDRAEEYVRLLRHVRYPEGAAVEFPHPASLAAYRDVARPRRFYLSHVTYGTFVDRCDVLANVLAVLCGVADRTRARTVMQHLHDSGVASPYPVKCWTEPDLADTTRWSLVQRQAERYQASQWRNPPFHYHNAGIWPFIGGFYVAALQATGFEQLASATLDRLAAANRVGEREPWEFREWLHGETGGVGGVPMQAWNAGAYVVAYQAVRRGTVLGQTNLTGALPP